MITIVARLKYAPTVEKISGRLGSLLYSHCGKAPYVRPLPKGTRKKKSESSAISESLWAEVMRLWKKLTPEQKAAWNALAKRWIVLEIFNWGKTPKLVPGETSAFYSGENLFVTVNIKLRRAGYGSVIDPPLPGSPSVILSFCRVYWTISYLHIVWDAVTIPKGFEAYKVRVLIKPPGSASWYTAGYVQAPGNALLVNSIRGAGGKEIPLVNGTYQVRIEWIGSQGNHGTCAWRGTAVRKE